MFVRNVAAQVTRRNMSRITSRTRRLAGPEDKHGVENAEEKNHIDFTPLDHR